MKTEYLSDVWCLESSDQEFASDHLSQICNIAIAGNRKAQNYLKSLWPECKWLTIKNRIMAEGSTWYVFWMDGVNQHLFSLMRD